MKALKRMGWWRTDDGRWFRHANDDGTDRSGLHSVEWSWRVGEWGPHLGFYYESGNEYNCKRRFYVGFLLGRVWFKWVGRTKNKRGNRRYGFELGRKTFAFYWGCSEHGRQCGYDDKGIYYFALWWDRLLDFLFGKTVYLVERKDRDWELIKGVVKMPEGDYPAAFTYTTRVWFRPRSPFRKVQYGTNVDIEGGIPFSGKGENSWDMGEDGLYGTGISGKTKAEGWDTEKAALEAADSAINTRMRRGDPFEWPMKPQARAKAIEERRASKEATD